MVPYCYRMQKLAKELSVVIPVSFFEEANNAHYNSVAVIDADGTDLGIYRKSHIPDGPGVYSNGSSSQFFLFVILFFIFLCSFWSSYSHSHSRYRLSGKVLFQSWRYWFQGGCSMFFVF